MKGNIFIKRPVMALSISVLILIVGFISLYTLPVEQYPDIAPPTVRVEATYTGANADAVMNSVIMPLEESINYTLPLRLPMRVQPKSWCISSRVPTRIWQR